jgi:probable DNA repair protein
VSGCLEGGGIVVAANERAARALRQSHADAQRAAGKLAWQTPRIYGWDSWLDNLWQQHLMNAEEVPLVLSACQERAVWKRIVEPQAEDADSLAPLAARAWGLLSDFQAHRQRQGGWGNGANADAEAFRNWASMFDRECSKNQWMSRSDLPALLTNSIGRALIQVPSKIMLVGFDRTTPLQKSLIDAARGVGCTVTAFEKTDAPSLPRLVEAENLRDELTTCAWWARRTLEEDASARIAVIVQDIEGTRGEIDRIFREILRPHSVGIESREAMPYEFSLGRPLAAIPVVQAALLLLNWLARPLDQNAVSWLLMCGFLSAFDRGSERSFERFAEIDAEMRRSGSFPPEIPLELFASYRTRTTFEAQQEFFAGLRAIHRDALDQEIDRRLKSAPEWLAFVQRTLRKIQWPGGRSLASEEFQALDRWDRLTSDVAGLGFDGSRIGYSEFVATLDRYSRETIFSPKSRDALIQIMGPFESSGQEFDAIWFIGADDRHWPSAAQPNPLLPVALQRQFAMPHAGIDIDWQLAGSVTQRLAAGAPNCIFSHAQQDEMGKLRPSPLLQEALGGSAASRPAQAFREDLNVPRVAPRKRQTVQFDDYSSIPWPRELAAGGAAILTDQSACPFRSFAVRRLGADELQAAERGLTPLDRGNLLHKVLQSLWSKGDAGALRLQTRDDLDNAEKAGRLGTILGRHIETVFADRYRDKRQSEWMKTYLQVERDRLQELLMQWLRYETKREPFTVVECEKQVNAEVGGLKLNLRVDRIDQVSGGSLILDYKTGKVGPSMWAGDRPDEPQLPLYGIYGSIGALRGVLFAQVRVGNICLTGFATNATVTVTKNNKALERSPLSPDILEDWQAALEHLADEFLTGEAAVSPKSYPKTCRYCALPSLCRVAETAVALEEEDEEAFDSEDDSAAIEEDASE